MSNQQPQQVPPGWYPDPRDPGRLAWWDGYAWAGAGGAVTGTPAHAGAGAPSVFDPPRVPNGTSSLTAYIWLIIGMPLLIAFGMFLIDVPGYVHAIAQLQLDTRDGMSPGTTAQFTNAIAGFMVQIFVLDGLALIIGALSIVFAYLDFRELKRRGFVRPFHWAWSFLGSAVYVIGRVIVTKSRGGDKALWPIWGMIAAFVVSLIVAGVLTAVWVTAIMNTVGSVGTVYGS